jgi:hypothetical protein
MAARISEMMETITHSKILVDLYNINTAGLICNVNCVATELSVILHVVHFEYKKNGSNLDAHKQPVGGEERERDM